MSTSQLQGLSLVGSSRGSASPDWFVAVNPATGEKSQIIFHGASDVEVERAAELAAAAFPIYSTLPGKIRAAFLRRIAEELEAAKPDLLQLVPWETALPAGRVEGELGRTCRQFRLYAETLEEGSWVDARIEHGDPARTPAPRPDVRSCLRPLGPVVVFGASNFPLAYSVAGGDTASALAAGCPVITKAHPAHPQTSERCALAIRNAVQACGLPEGVFSCLFDDGFEVGLELVSHPVVQAGGFTGSRRGGLALLQAAQRRPQPIPFYAEMSSLNPAFFLPGALAERGAALAALFHTSIVNGQGQFCTKPGWLLVPRGAEGDAFLKELAAKINATPTGPLLTGAMLQHYRKAQEQLAAQPGVRLLAHAQVLGGQPHAGASLFEVDVQAFHANALLHEEIFGPLSLVIRVRTEADMVAFARGMEGQLTATVLASPADAAHLPVLWAELERRAGRLVCNGIPTGVEVGDAIVHGGPFPSTSDGASTSVGVPAMLRWTRRVCYQGFENSLLPAELQQSNPLKLNRRVNSVVTRDPG